MNLLDRALGLISAVNPMELVTVSALLGSTTNPDGSRLPTKVTLTGVRAQIQPVATGELALVESLNIQGVHRRMYIDGAADAMVRATGVGGTLVTRADGSVWKVTDVPEAWQDNDAPNWTCCVITLQNNG